MTQKTTPRTTEADELRLLAMSVITIHMLESLPATGGQMSRFIDEVLIGGMNYDPGHVVDSWIALTRSTVRLDTEQVPGLWVISD